VKQNLLRAGFALILVSAILPATAGAHSGDTTKTSSPSQESRTAMPAGWSAGAVHRWSGYSRPGGSRRVRELQRRLNRLGYESGPVDGLFGPITERATRRFQARHGLRIDGIVGQRTLRKLRQRDARRRAAHRTPASERAPQGARRPPHGDRRPVEQPRGGSPQVVPERVAPEVQARAPQTPGPELPIVPVFIAFALLGVATFVASYLRTDARIRQMRGDPPRRLPRMGPTPRHEGGGG
jgi:hypothetical protein